MTTKRFTVEGVAGDTFLKDNELPRNHFLTFGEYPEDYFWLVDLLNKQHETITILQTEYDKLKHRHSLLHDEHLELEIERNDLKQYKKEVAETLQEAYNQNARHSNPISDSVCLMLKNIGKELRVDLK